jgi:hypothetical protein
VSFSRSHPTPDADDHRRQEPLLRAGRRYFDRAAG